MHKPTDTVRIPGDTRAPDWAWQKSQAMHQAHAVKADRAIEQRNARREERKATKQRGVA